MIARATVQHIVRDDYLDDDVKCNFESFNQSVEEQLSDQKFMADPPEGFYIQDKPDKVPNGIARTDEDYGDMIIPDTLDADDIHDNVIDKYLNAELMFDVTLGNKERNNQSCRQMGRHIKMHASGSWKVDVHAQVSSPSIDSS